MKSKKIVNGLLVMLFILSITIIGCDGTENGSENGTENGSESGNAVEDNTGIITIVNNLGIGNNIFKIYFRIPGASIWTGGNIVSRNNVIQLFETTSFTTLLLVNGERIGISKTNIPLSGNIFDVRVDDTSEIIYVKRNVQINSGITLTFTVRDISETEIGSKTESFPEDLNAIENNTGIITIVNNLGEGSNINKIFLRISGTPTWTGSLIQQVIVYGERIEILKSNVPLSGNRFDVRVDDTSEAIYVKSNIQINSGIILKFTGSDRR